MGLQQSRPPHNRAVLDVKKNPILADSMLNAQGGKWGKPLTVSRQNEVDIGKKRVASGILG